jgi:hypothetical protein
MFVLAFLYLMLAFSLGCNNKDVKNEINQGGLQSEISLLMRQEIESWFFEDSLSGKALATNLLLISPSNLIDHSVHKYTAIKSFKDPTIDGSDFTRSIQKVVTEKLGLIPQDKYGFTLGEYSPAGSPLSEEINCFSAGFTDNPPTSFLNKFSIVYIKESKSIFILPIELSLVESSPFGIYLGGFSDCRSVDQFVLYKLNRDNLFSEVFNTMNVCSKGFPVGLYDEGCVDYRSQRLEFTRSSENSTDELNFSLTGKVDFYCALGIDRDQTTDLPPLVTRELIANVVYNMNSGGWKLKTNSNICKIFH